MSATIINKRKQDKSNVPVDPNMRDYSNEPFFVKKAEKAADTIKKYGLPKEIEKRVKK
jgi:hypothetical protein